MAGGVDPGYLQFVTAVEALHLTDFWHTVGVRLKLMKCIAAFNNTQGRAQDMYITGRKRIIGARRACEQTSVFQLLGEIRERKHQHTMIHAHHHSVSTQVIVVLNFKI